MYKRHYCLKATLTTKIYTGWIIGSVRCVKEPAGTQESKVQPQAQQQDCKVQPQRQNQKRKGPPRAGNQDSKVLPHTQQQYFKIQPQQQNQKRKGPPRAGNQDSKIQPQINTSTGASSSRASTEEVSGHADSEVGRSKKRPRGQ